MFKKKELFKLVKFASEGLVKSNYIFYHVDDVICLTYFKTKNKYYFEILCYNDRKLSALVRFNSSLSSGIRSFHVSDEIYDIFLEEAICLLTKEHFLFTKREVDLTPLTKKKETTQKFM